MLRTLFRRSTPSIVARAACRCKQCPHCILGRRAYSTPTEVAAGETDGPKPSNDDSKMQELKDSYLRALADMENLRTRTKREVDQARQFGHYAFARDVIGVADVLEMALDAVRGAPSVRSGEADAPHTPTVAAGTGDSTEHRLKDLAEGLQMTLAELRKVFEKHGITPIDPLHQRFDPNFHMALFEVPGSGSVEPGTVLAVQKKGYLLNSRLLRSASVGVSK